MRSPGAGVVHQELIAGGEGKGTRPHQPVARPFAVGISVWHSTRRDDHPGLGRAEVHFEVGGIVDQVLAQGNRVMQQPSVTERHDEWIPIGKVDLVQIVAVGMFSDLGRDRDAEAHTEGQRRARGQHLWQRNGQPLPVEIVGQWVAVEQDIFEREPAAQVRLDRHDDLPQCDPGLVGVDDSLVHGHFPPGIIEQGKERVLGPR